MSEDSITIHADGVEGRVTHPPRLVCPEVGLTKLGLVEYYTRVAHRILPQTRGRALVMHRYPRGVSEGGFYQKRAPENRPEFVKTKVLPSPTNEGPIEYVIGENLATILWLVNLGAFEINPWLSLAESPEEPSHMVVDLDPMGGDLADVCAAALLVMSESKAKELGLNPLATIKAFESVGVDPKVMGIGPAPASRKAL